jgi:hypothetical protein
VGRHRRPHHRHPLSRGHPAVRLFHLSSRLPRPHLRLARRQSHPPHHRPHPRHLLRRRNRHPPQPRRLHRPTLWPPTPGQPTHRTSRRPSPRLHRTTPCQRRHQAPHRPQRPPGPRRRNPLLQRHHHRPRHRPLLQHARRPDRWLPTTRSRHRHHRHHPQSDALDQTLGVHTRFGLGYALPSTTFPLFGAGSFGHGGRGGSLGCAHPPGYQQNLGYRGG